MPKQLRSAWTFLSVAVALWVSSSAGSAAPSPAVSVSGEPAPPRRVYARLLDPREHPDYERRAVKPPGWATFRNRTQFTCRRGFGMKEDQIVGYAEELEKFTRIRGAGKQYEVPWFGNASFYNRWGSSKRRTILDTRSGVKTNTNYHEDQKSESSVRSGCAAFPDSSVGSANGWSVAATSTTATTAPWPFTGCWSPSPTPRA